jgi:hypothetical protein
VRRQRLPATLLKARQASAFARFCTGQRPGARGRRPNLRNMPLNARASASAKLHRDRHVIDSETDTSRPLRT